MVMKWVKGHERCKPRLLWGQREATSNAGRASEMKKSLGTFGGDDTEPLSKKQRIVSYPVKEKRSRKRDSPRSCCDQCLRHK